MPSLLQRLKERKLVQWALAYLAGAWALVEAVNLVVEQFHWSEAIGQAATVVAFFGFFVALVLAWYHGEKGRQRVSGPELLMLTSVFVVAGAVLAMLSPDSAAVGTEDQTANSDLEDMAALSRLPSIAVLPFANRSGVPDDQYFTDGMQDELLTRLQRVRGLQVTSRTSSDAYRDTGKRIPEIGRELGVRYVVEGGVQRAGDRVRINVQLIDASKDAHLWSETYERVLTTESLFDIQSEIVQTLAGALDVELREEERLRAARRSTTDLEAYELYLRSIDVFTTSAYSVALEKAAEFLEDAVERDSGFVAAYARLTWIRLHQYLSYTARSTEGAAAIRTAAERAVELAPDSEDAQMAMGLYLWGVAQDHEAALEWFDRASGALLGDSEYLRYRGWALRSAGRWPEALASLGRAAVLSPGAGNILNNWARTALQMRRYAEAEDAYHQQGGIRGPDYVNVLGGLAQIAEMRDGSMDGWRRYVERFPAGGGAWSLAMTDGRYEEALSIVGGLPDIMGNEFTMEPRSLREAETLEELGRREAAWEKYREAAHTLDSLVAVTPGDHRYHAALAWVYSGLGMREDAVREALTAVEIMPRERDAFLGPDPLLMLAAVHARFGETERALEVLENLLSAPSRYSPNSLEKHRRLRLIWDDPGFKALMDRERDRVF